MEGSSSFYDRTMGDEQGSAVVQPTGHVQPNQQQISRSDIQAMIEKAVAETTSTVMGNLSKRDAEARLEVAKGIGETKYNEMMRQIKEDPDYKSNEDFRRQIDGQVQAAVDKAISEYVGGNSSYLDKLDKMARPMIAANKEYMEIETKPQKPETKNESLEIAGVPDNGVQAVDTQQTSNLTEAEVDELELYGIDPGKYSGDRSDIDEIIKLWGMPVVPAKEKK